MNYINIVYDSEYDDADILLVPDYIADNIQKIVFEFFSWLRDNNNAKRFEILDTVGDVVLSIDTEEFVWWLNNIKNVENVKIVKQHTRYCSDYPIAEF